VSDIFHDIVDAGEHAIDAGEHVASAAWDAAQAAGDTAIGIGEHFAATGAELVGAQDTRDTLDNMAVDNRELAGGHIDDAGQGLSDAGRDFYNP
jgi:hypothetical protein